MFCANLISQNTTYTPNISSDLSLEHQLDIQLDIHTTWHSTLMSNKHCKQFSQNATHQPAKLIKIKSLIFTLLTCNSPSHAYFSKWCYHLSTWSSEKNFFLNLRLIQDDCSEVGSTDEEILTPALWWSWCSKWWTQCRDRKEDSSTVTYDIRPGQGS